MPGKDYYKTLHVDTDASAKEIKTSYRKLAFKYHPDKANENPFAEARFKDVQEAYAVLSNQKKKKEYDHSLGAKSRKLQRNAVETPATILDDLKKLNRELAGMDSFRMNQEALFNKIERLLSVNNLLVISEGNDMAITRFIIIETIKATEPLPYKHAEKICTILKPIALGDPSSLTTIAVFLKRKKQQGYWDKYKLVAAVVIAIMLCFVIFTSTQ